MAEAEVVEEALKAALKEALKATNQRHYVFGSLKVTKDVQIEIV